MPISQEERPARLFLGRSVWSLNVTEHFSLPFTGGHTVAGAPTGRFGISGSTKPYDWKSACQPVPDRFAAWSCANLSNANTMRR